MLDRNIIQYIVIKQSYTGISCYEICHPSENESDQLNRIVHTLGSDSVSNSDTRNDGLTLTN